MRLGRLFVACAVLLAACLILPHVVSGRHEAALPVSLHLDDSDVAPNPFRAVVTVFTSRGIGSGVFVSPHAVVTAAHVVRRASWVVVEGIPAVSVVRAPRGRDAALIWFDAPIGRGRCLRVRRASPCEAVVVSPHMGVVASVVVSGRRIPLGWWFFGMHPKPGMSGSPVVSDGVVVGIVVRSAPGAQGFMEELDGLVLPTGR